MPVALAEKSKLKFRTGNSANMNMPESHTQPSQHSCTRRTHTGRLLQEPRNKSIAHTHRSGPSKQSQQASITKHQKGQNSWWRVASFVDKFAQHTVIPPHAVSSPLLRHLLQFKPRYRPILAVANRVCTEGSQQLQLDQRTQHRMMNPPIVKLATIFHDIPKCLCGQPGHHAPSLLHVLFPAPPASAC